MGILLSCARSLFRKAHDVRDGSVDADTEIKTKEQKQKEVMTMETEKKVLDDEKKEEEAKIDYMKMEKNVRFHLSSFTVGL
jgi:hypothetical protein